MIKNYYLNEELNITIAFRQDDVANMRENGSKNYRTLA